MENQSINVFLCEYKISFGNYLIKLHKRVMKNYYSVFFQCFFFLFLLRRTQKGRVNPSPEFLLKISLVFCLNIFPYFHRNEKREFTRGSDLKTDWNCEKSYSLQANKKLWHFLVYITTKFVKQPVYPRFIFWVHFLSYLSGLVSTLVIFLIVFKSFWVI